MRKIIYFLCLLCQLCMFGSTQKVCQTSGKTVAPYIEILKQRMRVCLKRNKRAPSQNCAHVFIQHQNMQD